jgi:hypothetical protein
VGLAGLATAGVFSLLGNTTGQAITYPIGGAIAIGGIVCLIVSWAKDYGSVHRPDELQEGR